MLQPLITPFQEQTLQQVTYNPLVISITVKSHPCTSVTATPTQTTDSGYMVGYPWYMGTVTCVLTQPGSTDIRYTHTTFLTHDGVAHALVQILQITHLQNDTSSPWPLFCCLVVLLYYSELQGSDVVITVDTRGTTTGAQVSNDHHHTHLPHF